MTVVLFIITPGKSDVHNRFGLFLEDVRNKTLNWGREHSLFQCLDLVVGEIGAHSHFVTNREAFC